MTYDQWKTRDPNDKGFYDMPEDDGPTELELAYERIQELERQLRSAAQAPMHADIAQIIDAGWQAGKSSAEVAEEVLREFDAVPAQAPTQVTSRMVAAAIDAAWPGPEVIYSDDFGSAEAMMKAALEAALAVSPADSRGAA